MDCWNCERPVTSLAKACDGCGASLAADLDVDTAVPGLTGDVVHRRTAHILLAISILQAVATVFVGLGFGPVEPSAGVLVFAVGVSAIFFALHLWARRKPVPAAWTGLLLFVGLHVLDAIADPSAIHRGLVVKLIVMTLLVRAVATSARYERLAREFGRGRPTPNEG